MMFTKFRYAWINDFARTSATPLPGMHTEPQPAQSADKVGDWQSFPLLHVVIIIIGISNHLVFPAGVSPLQKAGSQTMTCSEKIKHCNKHQKSCKFTSILKQI